MIDDPQAAANSDRLSEAQRDEVDRLIADERYIFAVKLVKDALGLGLADAKRCVEHRLGRRIG